MCNFAEITRNETVWRMRTNNVKGVYYRTVGRQIEPSICITSIIYKWFGNYYKDFHFQFMI